MKMKGLFYYLFGLSLLFIILPEINVNPPLLVVAILLWTIFLSESKKIALKPKINQLPSFTLTLR
ncbi:MAG: hypothetical protein HamCj_00670 [Candidatus Hamiltonella defensa (Ceratovacuna japonica)]